MEKRDYYEILGVKKDASDAELKKQFRKLSKEFHPDKQGDKAEDKKILAENKFKELNEAYSVLSDKEKRLKYDQFGHDLGANRGYPANDPDLDAVLNDFMNRFGERQRPQAPPPIKLSINLTLKEVYHGATKKFKYKVNRICSYCNGERYVEKDGGKKTACPTCHGAGYVQMRRGPMLLTQTCPSCNGLAYNITNGCKRCNTTGFEKIDETIEITFPKGVPDGAYMSFPNKGNELIINGVSMLGDLIVGIRSLNTNNFIRENNNLHCTLNVSIYDCILGEEITVKTIDDKKQKFNLKVGTESGEKFRLVGMGMPIMDTDKFGDLYVHIKHDMPTKLTNEQIKLLKELKGDNNGE